MQFSTLIASASNKIDISRSDVATAARKRCVDFLRSVYTLWLREGLLVPKTDTKNYAAGRSEV